MASIDWIPVYRDDFLGASLALAFLQSDGLTVKMVPDVHSPPLQDPAAHGVKSQYQLHVLLVPAEDEDRARDLIESFLDAKETDPS